MLFDIFCKIVYNILISDESGVRIMDCVEMVAQMYRKRIAEGAEKASARTFAITDFPAETYRKVKEDLENSGFIKDSYIRNFTVNDSAIEYFMGE